MVCLMNTANVKMQLVIRSDATSMKNYTISSTRKSLAPIDNKRMWFNKKEILTIWTLGNQRIHII